MVKERKLFVRPRKKKPCAPGEHKFKMIRKATKIRVVTGYLCENCDSFK